MRINAQAAAFALACSFALLISCASPRIRTPAAPALGTSYLDLQPGWRLRVITPLLKSGGYRFTPHAQQSGSGEMTFSAGTDFMGYETSYYRVRRKPWTGLDIQFRSAQETRNGVTETTPNPRVKLFQLPRGWRYVRLIYLRRASESDHDMAVLAASDADVLASATKKVQTDAAACRGTKEFSCAWIPAGIAVIAERRQNVNGSEQWAPAR